jgi:membrane peptidoglycan carboxypeptidase
MGYDDNTPLTGVTGGGLPAEIWRETMARVHEGLPEQPLPMMDPSGRGQVRGGDGSRTAGGSGGGAAGILESLLRDILGSGGGREPSQGVNGPDR